MRTETNALQEFVSSTSVVPEPAIRSSIILCAQKDKSIVHYSVLHEKKIIQKIKKGRENLIRLKDLSEEL
jgi:hypothetical protein